MLNPEQMRALPDYFADIPDPRRAQGRRHRLATVLALAAGATLCGMRGYQAIAEWAQSLGSKARERFGCRCEHGRRVVPSPYVIRDVLVRVDPVALDQALQRWNAAHGQADDRLAIDGKTMRNAHRCAGPAAAHHERDRSSDPLLLHPKQVGTLAPDGDEEGQQTHEIKMAAPLLDAIEIQGKVITADALLTQRQFATYLVKDRQAHDHFTIKGNPPTLLEDVTLHFARRQEPDFVEGPELEHGRIETRKIWTSAALNDYLNFPPVGQVFLVERERLDQKTGQHATELAYGITSRLPEQADAQRLLNINRGHWSIENSGHDVIDWNFDEDRRRIRTGHGPENVTRLRRLAIGIIQSKGVSNVAQKMRPLHRCPRLVFDYLRMSANSSACAAGGG